MHPPQLLDGALGTALASAGVDVGGPAWSARALIEAPAAIAALHRGYAEAGATVHRANTFRVTRPALAAWHAAGGPALDVDVVAARAVALAREAARAGQRVAGSLGPFADCYRPAETPADTRSFHRENAARLARVGVDLIVCETFAHPGEIVTAVEEGLATGLPLWAFLTAGPAADLLSPAALARAAQRAADAGAGAVIVNCVALDRVAPFLRALRGLSVPFGALPNVGDAAAALGHLVDWGEPAPDAAEHTQRAARFAARTAALAGEGATLLGGCCGTSPAHVRALGAVLSASE